MSFASSASRRPIPRRVVEWMVVLALAAVYLSTLTAGHTFVSDDFAAYVMHAANLAERRPYADIRYVPNPKALWLSPSNGYPPVYPAILAPVYKVWGLNLKALKAVTVLCFVGFLIIFAEMIRERLPAVMSLAALLLLGLNHVSWQHRDYLLSEFPYLLFSFASLLVVQNVYRDLTAKEWRARAALTLSVLIYCAYGTRTIGIVLLPALLAADFLKFKKLSRFAWTVLGATAALILGQTIFVTSPKGYLSAVEISASGAWTNALYYAKTLSYFWQNGFSKPAQIVFALLFTALAFVGFMRKLWKEKAAGEFYLLGYTAVLCLWNAEIGLRGLLPVLPLYVVLGLMEFARISQSMPGRRRFAAVAGLLLLVAASYAGEARTLARAAPEPNVQDSTAQELFAYLKTHTEESDVLIFSKPRTLALFTNRRAGSFAPDESPRDSYAFMKSVNARFLVSSPGAPPAWKAFVQNDRDRLAEVFGNSEYQVFQVRLEDNSQHSKN